MNAAVFVRRIGAVVPVALFALSALCLWACRSGPTSATEQREGSAGIPLASGRVLPVDDPLDPGLPGRLLGAAGGRVHLYVRVAHGLQPADYGALDRAGLLLLDHLAGDTYVGSIKAPLNFARPPFDRRVLWVGEIRPEDKIHPALQADTGGDAANDGAKQHVIVAMHADVTQSEGVAALSRLGAKGEQIGGGTLWQVEVDRRQWEELAAIDEVMRIEPGLQTIRYQNPGVRSSIGSAQVQQFTNAGGSVGFHGASGEGIRIGVVDSGIDEGHPDFAVLPGDVACETGGTGRFYRTHPAIEDHGTHVAAIAAGNGSDSYKRAGIGAFDLRGHAPRACLGEYVGLLASIDAHVEAVVNDGTQVFNHSYVLHHGPEYMLIDREVDRMIRGGTIGGVDLPSRPHVYAAGNYGVCNKDLYWSFQFAGYHSVGVSAKNAIVVGSIDVKGDELSQFSSLGPTFDGRVKPELVAPGAYDSHAGAAHCSSDLYPGKGILSAYKGSGASYGFMSGTSMAAPAVTGVIALMMESLAGAQSGLDAGDVRPSTWRALLVQTAVDLERSAAPGPHTSPNPDTGAVTLYPARVDHATGYGKVDAVNACSLAADTQRWFEAVAVANGAVHEKCIEVLASDRRDLVVTLAWDDKPDETLCHPTLPRLVNDLDLVLVSPGGNTFEPWVVPGVSVGAQAVSFGIDVDLPEDPVAASRTRDGRNNLEQVRVSDPEPGTWTLRVKVHHLAAGWTQPFSVASSHPLSFLCGPEPPDVQPRVCFFAPWFCGKPPFHPRLEDLLRPWIWPPGAVLPLTHLRASLGLPLEPSLPAWIELPGFELVVQGLPRGARMILFDAQGEVRGTLDGSYSGPLRIERRRPGESFQLLIVGADGLPHVGSAYPSFELTELTDD